MERIDMNAITRFETSGHSSKGNQLKWKAGDYWYKADYMGYEGLAEVVVSRLLRSSNRKDMEFVRYEPAQILYGNRWYAGCKSRSFLAEGEDLITAEHLIRQFTGRSAAEEMARLTSVGERISYLAENVMEITGLKDFGAYLAAVLEIDAVFLNEDRHTNNIAVIYDAEKDSYRLCPLFDHGLSLFSDTSVDFPLEMNWEECRRIIKAKPFSVDFDEQTDEADLLYRKQMRFYFGEKEIREALDGLEELYESQALHRVEDVLLWQRRKYRDLFSG